MPFTQADLDALDAARKQGACGAVRKPDRAFALALFARGGSPPPAASCAGPTPRRWASFAPWLTSVL
ncbi:MAG: hypothetical protein NTY38_28500 [Acidobacteria bacterium]|nr:hypothetical protein [Acidobacteriota bacterium]